MNLFVSMVFILVPKPIIELLSSEQLFLVVALLTIASIMTVALAIKGRKTAAEPQHSTLAIISLIAASMYFILSIALVKVSSFFYLLGFSAIIPFILVLYFALKAVNIPTILKYIHFILVGGITTILIVGFVPS